MKKHFLALLFLSIALALGAKVKLPALMGDNMVLQQQSYARLWGRAALRCRGARHYLVEREKRHLPGRQRQFWLALVLTPEASFMPYEITFDDGNGSLTLKNVLIGEVRLASGQSNMHMPLKGFGGCCVKDGADEIIRSADYPDIRFFVVPTVQAYEPQDDC